MGTIALLVRERNSTKPLAPGPEPTSTLRWAVVVRISDAQPASKMRDELKPMVLREIFIDAFPFSMPSIANITACPDKGTSLKWRRSPVVVANFVVNFVAVPSWFDKVYNKV